MTDHAPDGATSVPARPVPRTCRRWNLADLYDRAHSRPPSNRPRPGRTARPRLRRSPCRPSWPDCPARGLARAVETFQAIDETLGRVMSYAQLLFSADSTDAAAGQFYQSMMERCTAISAHILFFRLELNRIDDAVLEAKLADPAFARWRPFLRDLRVWRAHQLSDELERFVHDREVTGRSAWSRLFDETVAGMRVPLGGEQLTVNAVLNKLSDPDREEREQAAAAPSAWRSASVQAVLADHQHARQGQGDCRHVAASAAPGQRPQPVQRGRGRGGGRAGHRRRGRFPAPLAPLLRAEGEMAGAGEAAALGPQRAAAGR